MHKMAFSFLCSFLGPMTLGAQTQSLNDYWDFQLAEAQVPEDVLEADLPDGWYEVTLHFAEIYSVKAREKLMYNLGAEEGAAAIDANRSFEYSINLGTPVLISNMKDFGAVPIKTRVLLVNGEGLDIQFSAINSTAFLCGIEIRGL